MIRGGQRITAVATGILCAGLLGLPRPLRADASSAIQTAQRQMNSGNYTAAISTLQAAIPGNPSSGELFYWLGRAYYEVRDWDNAVAQGEKSVSLDAKNSLYHDWLGREYGGKADRDRSFSDAKKVKSEFKQAVALDSSNIVARRDLEEYCLDAPWIAGGSKDEALEQVSGIAAVDPVAGHLAKALYDHEGTKNNDDAESEL
jgi:tetratricopeptide (TPR) repeat protein